MKIRTIALGGAALTAAGLMFWRRRRKAEPPALVQLGLSDGRNAALDGGDPSVAELQGLAATLRGHLDVGG